jgi:hypothetical protein
VDEWRSVSDVGYGDRMRLFALSAILGSLLGPSDAHASCEDQLERLDDYVKSHPREGYAKQVQKELRTAHEVVEVDELACLHAVAQARRALAAPTENPPGRYQPPEPVQPLNQPAAPPKRR